jgi:serine/alanine adding enzyme
MTSSDLRVVPAENRWAEWDRFVAADPQSTFCHRAGWHEVMTTVMRQQCQYLVAENAAGAWQGVLPLVHVRGLLGHYLVSMPFLDDGGPIGTPEARSALGNQAVAIARASGAKLLELRARTEIPGDVTTVGRKVAVHLRLPGSIDELWEKTFKAKLRSQVRRPSKEGMTARSGPGELTAFYSVFSQNMRDLGTPVLPRKYFEVQQRLFGDDVVFTTVYSSAGEPTAAACCFVSHTEIYVTWASSLRRFNKLSPNMLLYASMMELAIKRGLTLFNFGRSSPGAPTHRFKQQWGGVDVPLPWGIWSAKGEAATPNPTKPAMRIATGIWSRFPIAVANRLGPVLARQLP